MLECWNDLAWIVNDLDEMCVDVKLLRGSS